MAIVNRGKILVGEDYLKSDSKQKILWGVPGGHWEDGETLKECAIREVKEETGLTCRKVKLISVYDFYNSKKKKSYVTIGMKAVYVKGELKDHVKEGRKNWCWLTPKKALKLDLFPPDIVLIKRFLSGKIFE